MLELLAAIAKFFVYAASFAAAGVAFAGFTLGERLGAARHAQPGLIAMTAASMLLATIAGAVILLLRLDGQFDGPTLSAVWETPAGPAIALQLVGAALLLVFCRAAGVYRIGLFAAAGCALASFGVNGHSASIGILPGAIAFLHVCAASWWLGSVLLLREAGQVITQSELALLVRRFSTFALAIVGALAICGVVLTLTLIDFNRPEWLTPYAQALALKIILAVALLGIAAYNKLLITPRLDVSDGEGVRALNQTIGVELGLFASVFLATAWLTTFNSPHA